jgi:3-oxoacyl-[acyl-carrier protein] reductase
MTQRLKDKVAVITGAGRGLGKTLALSFAREGAKLLLPDISLERAENTAAEINSAGGEAVAIKVDISDENETRKITGELMSRWGRVDILVNNAAIFYGILLRPWDEWTTEEWNRMFAVNVTGTWLCCKAVTPLMVKQNKGKIINISSDIVRLPAAHLSLAYACSKAAVWTLTQAMGVALGASNINVNAIAPGLMATEAGLLGEDRDKKFDGVLATQAIKKRGEPTDMVGAALFLASEDSDYLAGQVLVVDGGSAIFL